MTTTEISPSVMDHSPIDRNPFGRVLLDIPEADSKTAEGFMRAARLDWEVEKRQPVTVGGVEFPKQAGIVAVDHGGEFPVGIVSSTYQVIQNEDAFKPFDYLIAEGLFTGWEQGGRFDYSRAFGVLGLDSECRWEGDERKRKAIVSMAHDATGAYLVKPWAMRVGCTNQEPMIFSRGGAVIRVKHTRSAVSLMRSMTHAVALMVGAIDAHEAQMEELASQGVSSRQVDEFLERLFPPMPQISGSPMGAARSETLLRDKRNEVRVLAEYGTTLEGMRSRYGMSKGVLLNAAIEWSDYASRTRGGAPQDRRAIKMLTGADVAFKRRAARILVKS